MYHEGDFDNKYYKGEKKRQRGSRWDKFDFWVYADIECSHTCLPKTKKKAPDFRHPDEVLNHK